MEVIFDKAAAHGAARGWSVRSRETLKALAERVMLESPESLRSFLNEKTNEITNTFAKTEGVPVSITNDNGTDTLLLVGLGRRSIILWTDGQALGGYLKWSVDQQDLLAEIFG